MSVMHRIGLIFGIGTALLLTGRVECVAADFVGKLYCANGDAIPGRLLSADGEALRWQTPLFKEPLTLSMPNLGEILFDHPGGRPRTTEPYRVVLRNRDVLYGEIKDINDQHVVLASIRHGQIAIDRSAVRSLLRMANSSVIYDGPIGLAGWQIIKGTKATKVWTASDDGQLSTKQPSANLFHPLDLPDQVAIEVTLRAKRALAFSLASTDQPSETIRVETWNRELVMTVGHEFEPIATLGKGDGRQLQLRLRWDRISGTLTAYSKDGSKMATIARPPAKDKSRPGFYIQNKGCDLTLARLRVTRWTGEFPREVDDGKNYIRLADGRIIYGRMEGFNAQQKKFRLETESGEQQIAVKEVDGVYLVGEAKKPDDDDKAKHKQVYFDGTRLTGVVTSMADGSATIRTTYCAEPIKSDLRGIARLSILNPVAESNDGKDQLYCDGGILHGSLVRGGNSNNEVHWQNIGGIGSNSLARECEARLVRAKNADQEPFDLERFGDTLFLTNRDTIPCRIKSFDKDFVHVHTMFTDMLKVPHEQVKAVELAATNSLQQTGFDDPDWYACPTLLRQVAVMPAKDVERKEGGKPEKPDEQYEGIVRWDAQEAVFLRDGVFRHDSMMNNRGCQFDAQWDPADNVTFVIQAFGDRQDFFFSGILMTVSCSGNTVTVDTRPPISVQLPKKGTATFGIQVKACHLHLMINNKHVHAFSYNPGKHDGRRLAFCLKSCISASEPGEGIRRIMREEMRREGRAPGWFPGEEGMREGMRREWAKRGRGIAGAAGGIAPPSPNEQEERSKLTLSRFKASRSFRRIAPTFVDLESKRQILTVQQFSKKSPPKHILIARDGDLLRGDLLSLNDETATFVSRRETVKLPRSRVATAIWLHEDEMPADEAPAADNAEIPTAQAVLNDGSRITVTPETMGVQSLIGDSPSLGKCNIPLNAIRKLHIGGYGKLDFESPYAGWTLRPAKKPRFSDAEGVKAAPGTALVGQPSQDFTLGMLDGSSFQLWRNTDKIVVLQFWATWCGSSVRAMPAYTKVAESLGKDDILFIGVNQGESEEVVREFLKRHESKMTVAMDPDQQIGPLFRVSEMPHLVVIGKGGTIEWVHVGPSSDALKKMNEAIKRLLKNEAVANTPAEAIVENATISALQCSSGEATAVASDSQAVRDDFQRVHSLLRLRTTFIRDFSASRRQMDECLETIMQVCKPSEEQMSRLNTAADGVIVSVRERHGKQFSAVASMIRERVVDVTRWNPSGPPPFSHPLWKKALDSVLTPKQRATYVAHIDKATKKASQQAVDAVVETLTKELLLVDNAESVKKVIGPVVADHIRREISNEFISPGHGGIAEASVRWFRLKFVPLEQLRAVLTETQMAQWQMITNSTSRNQELLGGATFRVKQPSNSERWEQIGLLQDKLFEARDRDGDGNLTFEEFVGRCFDSDPIRAVENHEFASCDEDKDGLLTLEEFKQSGDY